MRILLLPLLAVGTLPALLTGAPVPKPPAKKAPDADLLGTWKIVLQDGEKAEEGQAFVFDGEAVRVSAPCGAGVHTEEHVWTVDRTVTPHRMQWARKGFPNSKLHLLYEVTGDALKVGFYSLTDAQPEPPKSLEIGRGIQVYELRRSK